MKKKQLLLVFSLFMFAAFMGCGDDDESAYYPGISTPGVSDVIETINENEVWTIPVQISSEHGIKRATYFLVTASGNTLTPGDAVSLPINGNSIDTDLEIVVPYNLHSVIITVVDGQNNISRHEIDVKSVKKIAVLDFRNGVAYRDVACIGIPFTVKGAVASEWDLKEFSYQPVVNGTAGTPISLALGDKRNVDFAASIPVTSGLTEVIFKTVNEHGGVSLDTFKVNSVVADDYITVAMEGNITTLTNFYESKNNAIIGNISSGSDIKTLKYALTVGGVDGALQPVDIGSDLGNEYDFNFAVFGNTNIEKIKLVVENIGGKTNTLYVNPNTIFKATILRNVTMSADPAGTNCFFAAYMEPHVFGRSTALLNQPMIDWVLYKTAALGAAQTLSIHAFNASAAINTYSAPYLSGFTQLTYSLITAKRANITKDDFESIVYDDDLFNMASNPVKNGYSGGIATTANRRIGDTFTATSTPGAFIIGWGGRTEESVSPAVINNKSYGIGWVNSVSITGNGYLQLNFDLIVPKADQRTLYNDLSMVTRITPLP